MRRPVIPGLIVVAAVALLALLAFGAFGQTNKSSIDAQVARGKYPIAPRSEAGLPLLGSSKDVDLAQFRGKVVVLNVYASWCGPCRAEAPLLAKEQTMLARHGATMLGVTYEDNATYTAQFNRQYGITYPVIRDVSGDFVRSFGTTGVPETFVINRQGRIQALQRYPVTKQWFARTLMPILTQKPS